MWVYVPKCMRRDDGRVRLRKLRKAKVKVSRDAPPEPIITKPDHVRHARKLREQARKYLPALVQRQGDICAECGLPMRLDLLGQHTGRRDAPTIDHKRRIADGGDSRLDNLELVHGACNLARDRRAYVPRAAKVCAGCGAPKERPGTRHCNACHQAFTYLWAGVGLA